MGDLIIKKQKIQEKEEGKNIKKDDKKNCQEKSKLSWEVFAQKNITSNRISTICGNIWMLKFKTDESKIYFSKHIDVKNLEMCFFKNDKITLIISMNKNIHAFFDY